MTYDDYLKTEHWQTQKLMVRERANNVCERCHRQLIDHIHHLTYERLGRELPSDLLGVCSPCHEILHALESKRELPADLLAVLPKQQYTLGCSEWTIHKWQRLEYLLRVHARICRGIMGRHHYASKVYNYFDPYAGPGYYETTDHKAIAGLPGSAIRAIRILNRETLGYRAFLSDRDPRTWNRLDWALFNEAEASGRPSHQRWIADNYSCRELIMRLAGTEWHERTGCDPGTAHGLAFFDPTGLPDWPAIKLFSKKTHFRKIDILINVCSTAGKRVRLSPIHDEDKTISQHLADINKKYRWLYEPTTQDKNQFTLVFCSNWREFPAFENHGFYSSESAKGKHIERRMNLSRRELIDTDDRRPWLPGFTDD